MSANIDRPADTSKIAIKGFSIGSKNGAKPINFAAKTKPLPATLGKRQRTKLHDDSGDEGEEVVRHESVTGFDIREGGALVKDATTKGPLVIPKLQTKNWREEIRRHKQTRKNLLPPESQAQDSGEKKGLSTDFEPKWGLTITKKVVLEEGTISPDGQMSNNVATHIKTDTETAVEESREKTIDERAIDALMGVKSNGNAANLIIPITTSHSMDNLQGRIGEEDEYQRAIRVAPDVSTLEDYERVPVEEFGAALLRGMGWNEDDSKKGRAERPKEVKRRQNLLGLGATELKGVEELGAWVQKSDPKRLVTGSRRGGDRRPRASEYREREERKRESRDERYGGSYRRDRDDYKDRSRRH